MGWLVSTSGICSLILLAAIIPPLAAQETEFNCTGAAETSCDAFSALKIEVTSGVCTGDTGANCGAVAESKTIIRKAFTDWLGGSDRCENDTAEAAAEIVAQAVAQVWTSAFAQVTCNGEGFACGWSAGNARAWAHGLAESIAQAAADPEVEAGSAFCYADIRALAGVFAKAVSESQAEVCTSNGDAEAFLEEYKKTVETEIAEAFVLANAGACASVGDRVAVKSLCNGGGFQLGDICGGIIEKVCEGDVRDRCCDPKFKRKVCNCHRNGGNCEAPWIRIDFGETRLFEDQDGVLCTCICQKNCKR